MTCQCQGRDAPLASHEGRASLLEVLYASEGGVLSVTPDSRNRFLSLMRLCVLAWVCMGVYGSVLVYVSWVYVSWVYILWVYVRQLSWAIRRPRWCVALAQV